MNRDENQIHDIKYFIRVFLVGLVINVLLISSFIIIRYQYEYNKAFENIVATQNTELDYIEKILSDRMNHAIKSTLFLSSLDNINAYIGNNSEESNERLVGVIKRYLQDLSGFDFVTLLDIEGNEVFKVINQNGEYVSVESKFLNSKINN